MLKMTPSAARMASPSTLTAAGKPCSLWVSALYSGSVPIGGEAEIAIPAGASAGKVRATMALYEPLRRLPQIEITLSLSVMVVLGPRNRHRAPAAAGAGRSD